MSTDKVKRWAIRVGVPLLFLLLCFALYGIADATNPLVAAGVAVVVGLALWPKRLPRLDLLVLNLTIAILVAALAVVGANVLAALIAGVFDDSGESRLPILAGMVAAMLVFTPAAFWYLHRSGFRKRRAVVGSVVLAVLVIAGAPVLVGLLKGEREGVPVQAQVASQVDLLIVGDGSPHPGAPALPPNPTLGQFDIRYSVGVASGDGVRWTLVDEPSSAAAHDALVAGRALPSAAQPPVPRSGADSALLLVVDGTPPASLDPTALPQRRGQRGEVARWKRVAATAAPPGTPVFALLQSSDRRRLDEWRRWRRLEDVAAAQEQGQTIAETALQLAVGSATARADFALAMAHRPVLLFDENEPHRIPLAIDPLFREGRITLCDDRGGSTSCGEEPLRSAHGLLNGDTHLRLDLRRGGPPPGLGSAIYVHPVSVDRGRKHLLYLDYWWYLPGNPVDVGGGALCGAGLIIPGITCQGHESDWEGMTVVVNRSSREPRVVAVHYAQHDSVVRYPWRKLRERWQQADVTTLMPPLTDAAARPLAFVARGTHATYPEPCARACRQVAAPFAESAHRGNRGWVGNDTLECGRSVCLQMLPTRGDGQRPALWNAYTGQWGERHCRFTFYCDSGSPPTAPGNQQRYGDPARYEIERAPRGPQT